jgi:tetratricopeptide (TPR) repeat protein
MVAGMILALVPTAAIVLGLAAAMFQCLRSPKILWTFLLAVMLTFVVFLACVAAALPFYSVVKAFYGLAAAVPLCALAALGLDMLSGRSRWLQALVFVLLGTWALDVTASYWIPPDAPETIRYAARQEFVAGHADRARDDVEKLVREHPQDTLARILLARLYSEANETGRAKETLRLLPGERDVASRHHLLAILFIKEKSLGNAIKELEKTLDLDPDHREAAYLYALLARRGPDVDVAIAAYRNLLRIDPFAEDCHAALESLYAKAGNLQAARMHRDYAAALTRSRAKP